MAGKNDSALIEALQAADAAGDTQAAIKISEELYGQPVTHEVENAPKIDSPAKPAVNDPSESGSTTAQVWTPFGNVNTHIPLSQGMDRLLAGYGHSYAQGARGISQLFGGQTQKDTEEQNRMDAPLLRTGAGAAGDILGGLSQYVLPGMGASAVGAKIAAKLAINPGALAAAQKIGRFLGPATVGAGFGGTAPVSTDETRLGNTAQGAVAGELGHLGGNAVNTVLRSSEDALSKGARLGAQIADKYGINLSMPQMAKGFPGFLGSTLDKLPFSGADARVANQRQQYNAALGKISGIDTKGENLNMENWQQGRQAVGSQIGNMANATNAFIRPQDLSAMRGVVSDAEQFATPEVAKQVRAYADAMLKKSIVDPNPLPGGAIGTIPGQAWREANTALSGHMNRLGQNDGDLEHRLGKLHGIYMDTMEAGMAPEDFSKFQDLRKQYSNAMTIKPLVMKAGNEGVDPKLVLARANTQGTAFAPSGKLNDIGELGTFAREQMMSKYPDSGTAQRQLLYSGILGGGAAGLNALKGGSEGEDQNKDSAIAAAAAVFGGSLLGRGLNSRTLARLYSSRAPEAMGSFVRDVTAQAPMVGVRDLQADKIAGTSDTPPQPTEQPAPGMADGGQPQKSTFWDLVKTAYGELQEPKKEPPPDINTGDHASGTKGVDFDNYVARNVAANGG